MKAAVIEERPAKKDRRNKKDNKKRFNKTGAKKEAQLLEGGKSLC